MVLFAVVLGAAFVLWMDNEEAFEKDAMTAQKSSANSSIQVADQSRETKSSVVDPVSSIADTQVVDIPQTQIDVQAQQAALEAEREAAAAQASLEAAVAEANRIAVEAEAKRKAAEAEASRVATEAEAARVAAEAAKKAAEEEVAKETAEHTQPSVKYNDNERVLDMKAHIIHSPRCELVNSIAEEDKKITDEGVGILQIQGYQMCESCYAGLTDSDSPQIDGVPKIGVAGLSSQ